MDSNRPASHLEKRAGSVAFGFLDVGLLAQLLGHDGSSHRSHHRRGLHHLMRSLSTQRVFLSAPSAEVISTDTHRTFPPARSPFRRRPPSTASASLSATANRSCGRSSCIPPPAASTQSPDPRPPITKERSAQVDRNRRVLAVHAHLPAALLPLKSRSIATGPCLMLRFCKIRLAFSMVEVSVAVPPGVSI